MSIKQTLVAVINTLNGVTISGLDNWQRLSASIEALTKVVNELDESEVKSDAE